VCLDQCGFSALAPGMLSGAGTFTGCGDATGIGGDKALDFDE
jgi:hypothetical protein